MDRNPREMWLENIQRQHQSSSRPGAPLSNLSVHAASNAPFLSTPQYVRQAAAAAATGSMNLPGTLSISFRSMVYSLLQLLVCDGIYNSDMDHNSMRRMSLL